MMKFFAQGSVGFFAVGYLFCLGVFESLEQIFATKIKRRMRKDEEGLSLRMTKDES